MVRANCVQAVTRNLALTAQVVKFLRGMGGSRQGMLTLSDSRFGGRLIVYQGRLCSGADKALREIVKKHAPTLNASFTTGNFGRFRTARSVADYLAFRN
jgi:hypothetical protein